MARQIGTMAVLGAGDMGHGVAELAALGKFEVHLRDVSPDVLDRAMTKIRWSLEKLASRQSITPEQAAAALARIHPTLDLREAVQGADIVIEAVPERLDLKQRVFAEVEKLAPAHAILASNTSTMRITEIGGKLADPGRIVGMHFFNPVLLMDLIEVIPAETTTGDVVETTREVSARLGKTVVVCRRDSPGFITSRLIGVWVGAAIGLVEHGLVRADAIDSAMKFKAGFPMGPLELADYTGLDVGYHAAEYLASKLGPAYRPRGSLEALVKAGKLGKKTGQGFHEWRENRMTTALTPEMGREADPSLVLAVVANEAAKLLDQGIAGAAEIDLAMRNGCAFPKGPLEWADEIGLDEVVKILAGLEERTGDSFFEPYELLVELVSKGHLGKKTGRGFHDPAARREPAATAEAGAAPGSYETLLVSQEPGSPVSTITLHRPHRLNALNTRLLQELERALRAAESDETVRVVVLRGAGDKAFCVGADLQDGGALAPPLSVKAAREAHRVLLAIEKLEKPVIAAINGYAFGGGLELALACDFRLAARRAKLALPEVTLGLLPAAGGTQRLPKLIGLAHAKEIVLLGNRFDADAAKAWGVVHRVYDNETFEENVNAFARELATRAPLALRYAKQCLNAAPTTDMNAGMELEATAFGVLASTEDVLEGVTSLFAKKQPEFQGR